MKKATFKQNETHLPVTAEQFQALTNEILTEFNKLADPHFVEPDYFAQILMSAIHAMDHKFGYIKKTELMASCINRISCHLTYNVIQEIQARLKAKAAETAGTPEGLPTDNVVQLAQEEEHA